MQFIEVIGLDVGKKRTGLARINLIAKVPEPLETIETAEALNLLPDIIKQHNSQAVVVGLPRGMQAQETDQTRWVRDWTKGLMGLVDLPFYWQDEAATSIEAESLAKTIPGMPNTSIDSLSACILLQDFQMTAENLRWEIERQA